MGATIGGKLVVTPLRDDARGSAAIVIRGWAPSDWQPPSSPPHQVRPKLRLISPLPASLQDVRCRVCWEGHVRECESLQVRVEGVLRSSEQQGRFVPDNVPGSGPSDSRAHWYWLDGPAIARAAGLPPDTPLLEQVVDRRPQCAPPPPPPTPLPPSPPHLMAQHAPCAECRPRACRDGVGAATGATDPARWTFWGAAPPLWVLLQPPPTHRLG